MNWKLGLLLCFSLVYFLTSACINKEKDEFTGGPALPIGDTRINGDFYWQLSGAIKENKATVYDIDLFETSELEIQVLKTNGKFIICYFSAGTKEDWRPDSYLFRDIDLGKPMGDWPGETWVDIRKPEIQSIMTQRIAMAKAKGCDGLEFDNVDGYDNDTGLGISQIEQARYLSFLRSSAQSSGMVAVLKNAMALIKPFNLQKSFDAVLNEQCYEFEECSELKPFIDEGKPVWIVEYKSKKKSQCDDAKSNGFKLYFSNLDLNGSKWQGCE